MTLDQKFKTLEPYFTTAPAESSARYAFDDAVELYAAHDDSMAERRLEQAANRICGASRPDGWNDFDTVKLPTKDGESVTFASHGEEFRLKRCRAGTYYLGLVRPYHRARFGDADQIREDIDYVVQFGKLPPAAARNW